MGLARSACALAVLARGEETCGWQGCEEVCLAVLTRPWHHEELHVRAASMGRSSWEDLGSVATGLVFSRSGGVFFIF